MNSFLTRYEIDRAKELTRISADLYMKDSTISLEDLMPYWQDCPWQSHQEWVLKKLLPANWMTA